MYQYTALRDPSHIRILVVRPSAKFDDSIICSIEEVALEEESDYTALSYSWATEDGDATPSRTVVIEDVQHAVTQNLFEALRRLRHSKEPVRLWIDAICINQQDVVERSTKVTMMGRIYETASRTVAWLGEAPVTVANLSLRPIFEYVIREAPEEGMKIFNFGQRVPFFEDQSSDATFSDMALLLQRRYFTRRWIVQEIILGRHVTFRWHKHECPAAQFVTAASLSSAREQWMSRHNPDRMSNVAVRSDGWLLILNTPAEEMPDLLPLLELCNDMNCSDSRDRLYALSSLSTTSIVTPDYKKSVEKIYVEFATNLVKSGQARELFAVLEETRDEYGYLITSQLNSLPSWVPDLRRKISCGSRDVGFDRWTFDPQTEVHGNCLEYSPLCVGFVARTGAGDRRRYVDVSDREQGIETLDGGEQARLQYFLPSPQEVALVNRLQHGDMVCAMNMQTEYTRLTYTAVHFLRSVEVEGTRKMVLLAFSNQDWLQCPSWKMSAKNTAHLTPCY